MNRLFQFLRKLLIAALAGVFISISTFPGEVTALPLLLTLPSANTGSFPNNDDLLQLAVGATEKCPPIAPPNFENLKPPTAPPNFENPKEVKSKDGKLKTNLTAALHEFKVKGQTFQGLLYNESYTPETLRVKPGDTIDLTLTNGLPKLEVSLNDNIVHTQKLPQDTNLHYHGFNVSPLLGADDVVMHVHPPAPELPFPYAPVERYRMQFKIPENHPSGMFWYHPHVHTVSSLQVQGGNLTPSTYVASGMSGGIIIDGIEEYYPIVKDLTEQVMLFKDFQPIAPTQQDKYICFTLNGLVQPKISMKQGEAQFWRVANVGANTYLNLSLQNSKSEEQEVYILARDGNIVWPPLPQKRILLPPASRVEMIVLTFPYVEDLYQFNSLQCTSGDPFAPSCHTKVQYHLATVSNEGEPINGQTPQSTKVLEEIKKFGKYPAKKPNTQQSASNSTLKSTVPRKIDDITLPNPYWLAEQEIPEVHKKSFTFSSGKGEFTINGDTYDENRIDRTVQVGDIEEWTLENATTGHHAFHIHQLDFVDTTNFPTNPLLEYRDTIDLPPCSQDGQGSCTPSKTVVRIPFTNPVITGVFVYHCHILSHEDRGMMQNIKVVIPPKDKKPDLLESKEPKPVTIPEI